MPPSCCRPPAARPMHWSISPPWRGGARHALPPEGFDRIGRAVPVLLNLKPAGSFFMEDFHAGGGMPALWRRLRDHLDLAAPTVGGGGLGGVVAARPAHHGHGGDP